MFHFYTSKIWENHTLHIISGVKKLNNKKKQEDNVT